MRELTVIFLTSLSLGLFIANRSADAQSFGFEVISSQCEVNHHILRDAEEIQGYLAQAEAPNHSNFLEYREELVIQIFPKVESMTKSNIERFELEVRRDKNNHLYSALVAKSVEDETIFEIDTGESKSDSVRTERLQSLSFDLLQIIQNSQHPDLDYNGLYLADCREGICFPGTGFEETKSEVASAPDHLQYKIQLHRKDRPDQIISFNLDTSILGRLNAMREAEAESGVPSPFISRDPKHRLCLSLDCENRQHELNTQTEEFKKLESDFNRFSRHLHQLLQSSLNDVPAQD